MVDEYSHKVWGTVLKAKSEVAAQLKSLHRHAVVKCGKATEETPRR